ncbi:MAG: site-specific DNA-methyltransferase [Deltaproteobacteria bacterium]|jgi:site-specific DNA-methyltransferase (adenine-specific)|nr:site-specific DNA-methyltransferase [Deltaproteobacteria bacterium]
MTLKKLTINQLNFLKNNCNFDISYEESFLFNNIFINDLKETYIPVYSHKNGLLFTADSIGWLESIKDETIDLVFADPPYNINKADWDKFDSQEEYVKWSIKWISQISRILKPTGSLFICGFSEILADLKLPSMKFFASCKWLVWSYKNKANLGNDWGRSHESILHLRKSKCFKLNIDDIRIPYGAHTLKYPSHPQAESSQYGNGLKSKEIWTPHHMGAKPKDVLEIPTICNGMREKTKHPTQKPEELLRTVLLAASNPADVALDPFSGSGTTLVVAEQLDRKWIGCDINSEYNDLAIDRLKTVLSRSVHYWIDFDNKNKKRRESLR